MNKFLPRSDTTLIKSSPNIERISLNRDTSCWALKPFASGKSTRLVIDSLLRVDLQYANKILMYWVRITFYLSNTIAKCSKEISKMFLSTIGTRFTIFICNSFGIKRICLENTSCHFGSNFREWLVRNKNSVKDSMNNTVTSSREAHQFQLLLIRGKFVYFLKLGLSQASRWLRWI